MSRYWITSSLLLDTEKVIGWVEIDVKTYLIVKTSSSFKECNNMSEEDLTKYCRERKYKIYLHLPPGGAEH